MVHFDHCLRSVKRYECFRFCYVVQGGVDGPVPLSAYVLLTLQECIKDGVRVSSGIHLPDLFDYTRGWLRNCRFIFLKPPVGSKLYSQESDLKWHYIPTL